MGDKGDVRPGGKAQDGGVRVAGGTGDGIRRARNDNVWTAAGHRIAGCGWQGTDWWTWGHGGIAQDSGRRFCCGRNGKGGKGDEKRKRRAQEPKMPEGACLLAVFCAPDTFGARFHAFIARFAPVLAGFAIFDSIFLVFGCFYMISAVFA